MKEWFFVQGSRRRPSRSSPKFTCPSCRAAVRETRPNATVTTLLDIVLAAYPDRNKSQAEKEEISQRYKPGDSVFPREHAEDSEEDDQRVLEEVRQLSLQESRPRTRDTHHGQPHPSRTRHTDHDARREEGRSRRRRDEDRTARRQDQEHRGRRTEGTSENARRIEHQSSLRSLLSLTDSETMEEEILRQILEEGLLDDIDMDNLGPRQEEELSERIAEAYRRRHRLRSRSNQPQDTRDASHPNPSRPRARSHSVQRTTTGPPPRDSSRPPASRPYLLEPLVSRPGPSNHQSRQSEQGSGRRRTSPVTPRLASSSEVTLQSSARSSSDMTSERPRASQTAATRTPESTPRRRRATESERGPRVSTSRTRERGSQSQASNRPLPLTDSPTSVASPLSATLQNPTAARSEQAPSGSTVLPVNASRVPIINGPASQNSRSRPSSSRSNGLHAPTPSYIEPSISCDRCGKANIQYDLHKTCLQCNDGKFHLCLRCYRVGRGCLSWPGFGASAQANFERILIMSHNESAPARETPHVLISSKYKRPSGTARRATDDDRQMTSDDPARRLQTGLFCDTCNSTANDCYWKCDLCNEGDWGFCNRCVNQGKCCTHALLPICRITSTSADAPGASSTTPAPNENETFKILSFSTNCDICTYPIPASTTRFHCLTCNDGDYDVCANCYLKLGATGKISKENSHNGWRRCIRGHRMIVTGFEDHDEGQKRVVVRDLVGGRALKDEHLYHPSSTATPVSAAATGSPISTTSPEVGTGDWSWKEGAERRKKASRARTPWANGAIQINTNTSSNGSHSRNASTEPPTPSSPTTPTRRFPPDGGVGVIVHALWSWYPEDGVEDELMFPRGAEITEGENINDDWFWGCYAGVTGLFPGAHVTVVGEVG